MNWFLDTNTCIYFLKGQSESIRDHLFSKAPIEIKIPAIVKAELLLGAEKSNAPSKTKVKVESFLANFECIPFDDQAAESYAQIRSRLEKQGTPADANDTLIAAIVKSRNGTLVTHNLTEFKRIAGLKVVDWY